MSDDFEHIDDGIDGCRIFPVCRVKVVVHASRSVDHEVEVGTILLRWQNLIAAQARVWHGRPAAVATGNVVIAAPRARVVLSGRIGRRLAAPAAPP